MSRTAHSTWIAIAAVLTTFGTAEAQPTVEYDWSGGGLRGIPLVPGRTYHLEIQNRNTLCYAYQAEVVVRESNADLGAMITALGYTQASTPAADGAKKNFLGDGVRALISDEFTVEDAAAAVGTMHGAVEALREAGADVEALVKRVEAPVCTGRAPIQPLLADWDALDDERAVIEAADGVLPYLHVAVNAAQRLVDQVNSAEKATLTGQLANVRAALVKLSAELPPLAVRLAGAEGRINTARGGLTAPGSIYLPAGTSGADLTIRATELNPQDGKTAAVIENKVPLPLRRGMRVFLSVGVLASTVKAHDFARANRVYGDTVAGKRDSTYSTYIDRAGGRGLGFAPVLQTNVAFRDVFSTGTSFHVSLGVASRSVNGRVSPEFIFGAGTGFLDHFLVTAGYHLSRDERLLLGNPAAVAQRPVPTTITDADAIGEIWRSSMVMTVTLKL